MLINLEEEIANCVSRSLGAQPCSCTEIGSHASKRRIFRVLLPNRSIIAVFSEDILENDAFYAFTEYFYELGLPVPQILNYSRGSGITLQEDLGSQTVLDWVNRQRIRTLTSQLNPSESGSTAEDPDILALYKQILKSLAQFQSIHKANFPWQSCHPSAAYTARSASADLHSFLKQFLVPLQLSVNEAAFFQDTEMLAQTVTEFPLQGFMYRDFQGRNIMLQELPAAPNTQLREEQPWLFALNDQLFRLTFIDYQNGMLGPCLYDLASSLYQGSAKLTPLTRQQLADFYFEKLAPQIINSDQSARDKSVLMVTPESCRDNFKAASLLFLLKVLGTYGLQGLTNGKEYFLKAIPLAIDNVYTLLQDRSLQISYPYLAELVGKLHSSNAYKS